MGIFSRTQRTDGIFSRRPSNGQVTPARTRLAFELRHTAPLIGCRFDPSGRFVFASSQDNTIQRWDLNDRAKVSFAGHRSWVRGLAYETLARSFRSQR